jgi:TonB-dependent starch-binding outer membrane protein SusC
MKQKLLRSIRNKKITMLIFSMLVCTVALSQQNVSGKVTGGTNNQPISGATVAVKGTNVATSTSNDGAFSITVPSGRDVLVVSFIGFDVTEVNIAGKSDVTIALKERTSSLSEVVVTGYTSQAKKDITGSVAVVNANDLKSVPAANAESQLQGRASGVTVLTSGRPGDGASVRIRGFGSFGGNEPLYIIDGVPGNLNSLNPNDIESMQVLKDAASASVYGSRASSGVIIITTKKGRQGTAKVAYNMYYGQSVPGDGISILNPQEMADLAWLAKTNIGAPLTHAQYGTGATPRLPDYILAGTSSGLMAGDPATDPSLYNLNIDNVSGSYLIVPANKQGTNWYDELTDNAPITNHNIAVSGGADRSRYLFSFDYFKQNGIVLFNFYKRYTARINTEFSIKKTIRIGQNLQIFASEGNQAQQNAEGTEIANTYQTQPIIPVYNITNKDFAGNRGANLGNVANPIARRIRGKDDRNLNYNFFGNMYAEVDFLKHFTARTSFGGLFNNNSYYSYSFQTYENAENNSGNTYTEGFSNFRSWTWTNQLTYKNTFGGVHDFVGLIGTEAVEEWGRNVEGVRVGYFTDLVNFRSLNSGSGTGQRNSGAPYTPASLFSLFGKVDYAWNDRILASFTIRRDGSSRFGSENRYGVFPAGSLGWRVSREGFMQGIKWITDLKLRGSYGQMGNQRINPANQFTQYASGPGSSNYDITGAQSSTTGGFQLSFVGNNAGKWETNTTTNVGFDATLFGGKTEIIAEYYNKKTEDLLFQLQQVATAGAGPGGANLAFFNVASMKNTGFDFLLTHRTNFGGQDGVKFDATLTFTTYKNEITKLAEGVDFFDYDNGELGRIGGVFVRNEVGQPIASFFGYQVIGLFQSADDVSKSPVQNNAAPGRFKYLDADSDGDVDQDDRVFFGNPNPDFTYGLNLDAGYKGFDFSVFFYGSQGKDAINYTRWWTDFVPSFQNAKSPAALYNSWTPSNPNATVAIQEESGNFSTNGIPNSYYLEDASYFRMKSITLGYALPSSLLGKYKIERLRIYVQATNLLTVTNYTGMDPEIIGDDRGFGFDAGVYPTVKQFLIGVNLNF